MAGILALVAVTLVVALHGICGGGGAGFESDPALIRVEFVAYRQHFTQQQKPRHVH